jgi:hypothetical protein
MPRPPLALDRIEIVLLRQPEVSVRTSVSTPSALDVLEIPGQLGKCTSLDRTELIHELTNHRKKGVPLPPVAGIEERITTIDGPDAYRKTTEAYALVKENRRTYTSSLEECFEIYQQLKAGSDSNPSILWYFYNYLFGYAEHISKDDCSFKEYIQRRVLKPVQGREDKFQEIAVGGESYSMAKGAYLLALKTLSDADLVGTGKAINPVEFTLRHCLEAYIRFMENAKIMENENIQKPAVAYLHSYTDAVLQGTVRETFEKYLCLAFYIATGIKISARPAPKTVPIILQMPVAANDAALVNTVLAIPGAIAKK